MVDSTLFDESFTFILPNGGNLWNLDRRITKALKKLEITQPTLVQAQVIPLSLEGKDLLVRSRTGSGKTFTFLIPLVQKILSKQDSSQGRKTTGIILVPTKELCDQTENALKKLLHYCTDVISFASLSTGSMEARKARLNEVPDILISTPGKLAEHIREDEKLYKNEIEMLIIDECDLVLSYGCESDVKVICSRISRSYQGMLLSATLDEDVNSLKKIVLNEPVTVKLQDGDSDDVTNNLKQWYLKVAKDDKDLVIFALIKLGLITGKTLFFVNTVDRGYRLKLFLEQFGVKSAVLNAELPANSRKHLLESYDKGVFDFVIATDEAIIEEDEDDSKTPKNEEFGVARGVDFRHVQAVVNVDLPKDADGYVHRIGRTARAGANGIAVSIVVNDEEDDLLKEIQENFPKKNDEAQPAALALDIAELEGFRYRVDGMKQAVKKKAIKAARVKDLKNEMLNSEKLQAHFQDNPRDLQLLKHDAPLKSIHVQKHLSTVPSYLLPNALLDEQKAALGTEETDEQIRLNNKKNKKRFAKGSKKGGGKRRKRDPLF